MVENVFLKNNEQKQFLNVKGILRDTMKFWIIFNNNKIFGRLAVGSTIPFSLVP